MPGVARAQNNIGACFAEGLGVERDASSGRALADARRREPATRSGQRNLAALYFKGDGVEQDTRAPPSSIARPPKQAMAPAQDMLSWMLLEGDDRRPTTPRRGAGPKRRPSRASPRR